MSNDDDNAITPLGSNEIVDAKTGAAVMVTDWGDGTTGLLVTDRAGQIVTVTLDKAQAKAVAALLGGAS